MRVTINKQENTNIISDGARYFETKQKERKKERERERETLLCERKLKR